MTSALRHASGTLCKFALPRNFAPRHLALSRVVPSSPSVRARPHADTLLVRHRRARPRSRTAAVPPASVEVLGVPLALTDYERHAGLDGRARSPPGARGYVCVAAVHTVMACQEDPELRDAVLGADLTVPDGQPLVWALNALGHDLLEPRLRPRPDGALLRARRATGTRMFLYGGRNQGALVQLALQPAHALPGPADRRRLLAALPRARPTRRRTRVVDEINRSRRRRRLGRHRRAQAGEVDGRDARPPRGARARRRRRRVRLPRRPRPAGARAGCSASGLEWAFRLAQEPRRLWRRYLRYNPRFVAGFARQYARHAPARAASLSRA